MSQITDLFDQCPTSPQYNIFLHLENLMNRKIMVLVLFVSNFSTVVNTLHLSAMEDLSSCKNLYNCVNTFFSFFMLNPLLLLTFIIVLRVINKKSNHKIIQVSLEDLKRTVSSFLVK